MIKNAFYILLLGLAAYGCNRVTEQKDSGKPNIVLILADDMGCGDLSCYGQEILNTPNIDQMASEGVMFTNHYTGCTVCAPSRASLLTGLHTGHVSVRGNSPEMQLYDEETTLGEIMKQAGYMTGAIGKWGVGSPPPVDDPSRNGFDYFYGYINMWHAHNFYPEFLYCNEKKEKLPGNQLLLIDGQNPWADQPEGTGVAETKVTHVHDLFDREALDFITANRDTSFFLYLAYNVPHANNEAGRMFKDGMEVPSYGEFSERDWPNPEKGFASMIRNLDNSLGLIVSCLEELGLTDNTLVIFVSDNGPHEEGNHRVDFFNSNGDLRGKKRDLYEGGIRTPFIAKWPHMIEPGSISDHLSCFWDFLPSFCELAGVAAPENTDGISFIPAMTGKDEMQEQHPYLYWEFYEEGGKQAVRKGSWKGIRLDVRVGDPYFELYDLSKDPSEELNIAGQHPEIVSDMIRIMEESHTEIPEISLFKTVR
jgi:arylsulfatase A-like enzyme